MIQDQLKKGKTPTSLLALQQIADFMTTSMPSMYPAAPQGGMAALNMSKQIEQGDSRQESDLRSASALTRSRLSLISQIGGFELAFLLFVFWATMLP